MRNRIRIHVPLLLLPKFLFGVPLFLSNAEHVSLATYCPFALLHDLACVCFAAKYAHV